MKTASIGRFLILLSMIFLTACAGQTADTLTAPAPSAALASPTSTLPQAQATPIIPITSTEALPQEELPLGSVTLNPAHGAAAPNCTSPAALTPAMTEGPYFKAGSPEKTNLAEGLSGTKLSLTGFVLTADCAPVADALIEFWQADAQGQYDNAGYTLRGHQTTDANGRYQLETVVPGLYPGRTEHIHVKVQPPNGPLLTTQLYFPGVSQNQSDNIYNEQNLINIQPAGDGLTGTFNFIVTAK